MKYVTLLLFVVPSLVRAAHAEIITVPFSATVTEAVGAPFGIVAQVGAPVTGSFEYDSTATPSSILTNEGNFDTNIVSGFVLNVGGVTITSSQYIVSATDHVENFGGSDLFTAGADSDRSDLRANGVPVIGSATMWLVDTDETMYAVGTDTYVPPTQAQLSQADFNYGFLGDEMGAGGHFVFRTVPEPSVVMLAAQALGLLVLRRTVRTSQVRRAPNEATEFDFQSASPEH